MERPMGLEPTPGPWQGPVLPLYYGRTNQENCSTPALHRQALTSTSEKGAPRTPVVCEPDNLDFAPQIAALLVAFN
jgi:hypothetical protein